MGNNCASSYKSNQHKNMIRNPQSHENNHHRKPTAYNYNEIEILNDKTHYMPLKQREDMNNTRNDIA